MTEKRTVLPENGLNLRRKASVKAGVITVLRCCQTVELLDEKTPNGWAKVRVGDVEGYVMSKFLSDGGGDADF